MKQVVEKILNGIKKGNMFDTHFLIGKLIQDHTDEYSKFSGKNPAKARMTEVNHGKLGKLIGSFGNLVEKQEAKSVSYNIREKVSVCALWKRI